jgi:hypothetical protein
MLRIMFLKKDLRLQQKILSSFVWRRVHLYFLVPTKKMKKTNFSMMKLQSTLFLMNQKADPEILQNVGKRSTYMIEFVVEKRLNLA